MTGNGSEWRPADGVLGGAGVAEGALAGAWALLFSPVGPDWSGRQRYAAAMSLWQAGEMPTGVLELYRICSRLDHEDALDLVISQGTDTDWLAVAQARRAGR